MKQLKELSFSEYFLSKQKLLEHAEDSPRIYSHYTITSYRKIPLLENYENNEKIYLSFKPKDKIKILWEYENIHFPTALTVIVINEDGTQKTYYPCWGSKKLLTWVNTHAQEVDHDSSSRS